MNALIASRLAEVETLCARLGVRRLDLFGSAARGDFDAEASDLDFLVSLDMQPPARPFDTYFELKAGLEALFGRPVDLVSDGSVENPYRRARIEAERRPIYAR